MQEECYTISSRTKKGVKYQVSFSKTGWRCDCKWDTIRRKNCRKDCRHIKLAKVMGQSANNAMPSPNTKESVQYANVH